MPHLINWDKWNSEIIEKTHGRVEFYRDLYDGKHNEIFPRAKNLIESGEVVEVIQNGVNTAIKLQPPYIVANVAKLVVDIPAMLVSRAVGKPTLIDDQKLVDPEYVAPEQTEVETEVETETKPTDEGGTISLSKIITDIHDRSRLSFEHWTNITQHQVDGGIVGVVINDDNGIRIQTKARDMYFPHEDGLGCDLVYDKKLYEETDTNGKDIYGDYIHIHREYIESGTLHTEELLFQKSSEGGADALEQIEDETEVARLLEMEIGDIKQEYADRDRPFVVYWANDKTFRDELGQSALKNQEAKQEEINWTLTRNAIVYQRNGKPRIAVSKEIFKTLEERAYERYGDETKIDSDDLEITTFDEKGKAIEVVQIDVSKIGDIAWVKDLMKLMFVETRTSEKAVDFYLEGSGSPAQSGIAKFYDLFVSIMKSEKIATEYIEFLEELFENALYFIQKDFPELEITRPQIPLKEMIPVQRKEMIETENAAYGGGDGIQSLEQSVKRANPHWTDEEVESELDRIEEGKATPNSTNLAAGAGSTNLQNLLDNRDASGNPIDPNGGTNPTPTDEGDAE